jgi:hypothetical protein
MRVGHERPAGCAKFPAHVQRAKALKSARATTPPALDAAFEKAIRQTSHPAAERQSRALLIQELTRLEHLLRVTKRGAPERAGLIRRLAEGYAELERLAALERIRADLALARVRSRSPKAPNPTR